MDPVLLVIQFVHLLAGAVWLGGSVFLNLVVLPAVFAQPVDQQRRLARRVILGPERLMVGAALTTLVLGVVRGTAFGPVRSMEAVGTRYGLVWVAAIVITLVVFVVGGRVTSPAARALLDDDGVWQPAGDGRPRAELEARIARVRYGFRVELVGILVVLALMPILRFS